MSESDYLFQDGRSKHWIEYPIWQSRSLELGDIDGVRTALFRGVVTDVVPLPALEQRSLVAVLLIAFGATLKVSAACILEWFPNATILDVQTNNLELSQIEELLSNRAFSCVALSGHHWTDIWPVLLHYGQSIRAIEIFVAASSEFDVEALRSLPGLTNLRILSSRTTILCPKVPMGSLTRVEILGLVGHLDINKSFPTVSHCAVTGSWISETQPTIGGLEKAAFLESLSLSNCAILCDTRREVGLVEFWADCCDLSGLPIVDTSRLSSLSVLNCVGLSRLIEAPISSLRNLSLEVDENTLAIWSRLLVPSSLKSISVFGPKVNSEFLIDLLNNNEQLRSFAVSNTEIESEVLLGLLNLQVSSFAATDCTFPSVKELSALCEHLEVLDVSGSRFANSLTPKEESALISVDVGWTNLDADSVASLFRCANTCFIGLAGTKVNDIGASRVANLHINALDMACCKFKDEMLRGLVNLRYCNIENTVQAEQGGQVCSILPNCYFDW